MRVTSTFSPAFVPAVRPALLALVAASGLLLASASARAQVGACEDLKARLAQRISGGPGSYVMEAVPAAAAVPAGVKVIGTCGGGAWKVLFRRGSAPIVLEGVALAQAPVPAPRPTASPSPAASSTAPKPSQAETAGATAFAATAGSAPTSRVAPGKEDARPADRSTAPAARPEPGRASLAEPGTPYPAGEPPTPSIETAPGPMAIDAAASDTPSPSFRTVIDEHGLWIAGFVALPLFAWVYAWVARRRAYDEQGLPRGPRLN